MKRILLFIITLLSVACTIHAQSLFDEAEAEFELGHFTKVDSMLQTSIKSMSSNDRLRSYRLLALSSLYQDRPEDAELYVSRLLSIDPYFTTINETPRFAEIIERLKKGKTTITTASKMAETVEEVPVPMTLITEDMIRASGARNVSDLLMLYVPGVSLVGSIEDNLAMRGVYGMSQETMLVMVDGHRINALSTNSAALDYRYDLSKIQQIEVLRGPASSLYGNAALTAVVNIITKRGTDIEGGQVSAQLGNFNTYGGGILFGNGNLRTEYAAWASVYNSQGESMTVGNTTRHLGGYNSRPTYDLGLNIRWGDIRFEVIGQHSKKVPYSNLLAIGDMFSYDRYSRKNGDCPGFSTTLSRVDIDYSHTWNNFTLSTSAYAMSEKMQIYNVLGDSVYPLIAEYLASITGLYFEKTTGLFEIINWHDYGGGGSVSGTTRYELSNGMKGSVIAGAQYEVHSMSNADLTIGYDYINISQYSDQTFTYGPEHTLSAFFQLKHNFTNKLILNGGLRYDHKIRQNAKRFDKLSPRVSLIYLAGPTVSFKGGYSRAFVDAPLLYRSSKFTLFSGGTDLNPETTDAFQVGTNFNFREMNLQLEGNLFYNITSEMVYFNPFAAKPQVNDLASSEITTTNTFTNSSQMDVGGAELTAQYKDSKYFANLNLTYQYPFKVNDLKYSDHKIANVPKFLLNLTGSRTLIDNKPAGKVSIRGNMHVQSSVECQVNQIEYAIMSPDRLFRHQPSIAIFGAGADWVSPFGLTVSLDADNIFGTRYYIGGQIADGIPSQTTSLLLKATYKF